MAKKYIVDLNKDEKAELVSLTQKGRPGARKIKRANILLLANARKPDFEVAELLHISWLTVLRTRHRFVEGGMDFALNELPLAGRLPNGLAQRQRRDWLNSSLYRAISGKSRPRGAAEPLSDWSRCSAAILSLTVTVEQHKN
jgi:hypothetical protein